MIFKKTIKKNNFKENNFKEILDQASKCKKEELQELLNQIQTIIVKSNTKYIDQDLLRAQIIITSRLAAMEN